jgi:hypothetical protein
MIEKSGKVDSQYYESFCDDLGLEYVPRYPDISMDFSRIEASYMTKEPIFDYGLIKRKLKCELTASGVKVVLRKKITKERDLDDYDVVINATYFNINKIKGLFGLCRPLLKMEVVVIPVFRCCMEMVGLTIMDGEFCSVMPNGFNKWTFLLYHVKESVVLETEAQEIPPLWYYGKEIIKNDFIKREVYDRIVSRRNIGTIKKASEKYFWFLKNCDFIDYWQTVRALPINDNDERLSVFDVEECNGKKIISVLSGKISTCLLMAKDISKSI